MAKLQKPKISNPQLKLAVAEWKENKTPLNEEKMYDELKKAKFIAPAVIENLPEGELEKGKQYEARAKFMLVKDNNGNQFFPAFTQWLEVLKWNNNPDTESVVVTFENYASLLLRPNAEARGLVIDPKGMNLFVPTAVIAKIMGVNVPDPSATQPVRKQVNMKVADPEHFPEDLTRKLTEQFELNDSIGCAYLIGMANSENENEKSYFIVLDMANIPEDARKLLFNQLGKLCQPYVNLPIGILPIQTPAGLQLAKTHKPFYTAADYDAEKRLEEVQKIVDKIQEESEKNAENNSQPKAPETEAEAEENRKKIVQNKEENN